jgi:hypothetical protein
MASNSNAEPIFEQVLTADTLADTIRATHCRTGDIIAARISSSSGTQYLSVVAMLACRRSVWAACRFREPP